MTRATRATYPQLTVLCSSAILLTVSVDIAPLLQKEFETIHFVAVEKRFAAGTLGLLSAARLSTVQMGSLASPNFHYPWKTKTKGQVSLERSFEADHEDGRERLPTTPERRSTSHCRWVFSTRVHSRL